MGTFNARLLAHLTDQWHVSALVPIPWRDAWTRQPVAIPAFQYRAAFPSYWYLPSRLGRATQGTALVHSIRREFDEWCGNGEPALVLSYWAYPDGDAAGRLAKEAGIRSATIVGGSDILVLAQGGAERERIRAALLRHDAIFTVGDHLANAVAALGVPRDRVRSFRRGVDMSIFSPGDRDLARQHLGIADSVSLLLWVGRMEPVKDLPNLPQAIAQLPQGHPILLALVGDGSRRRDVIARAAELGIQLITPGFVAPEELRQWYAAADAFVLSSRSEGTPNVLLEAAACGLPIITTEAGGAGHIARELGGRVVPVGDPAQLAEAISETLAAGTTHMQREVLSAPQATAAFSGQLRNLLTSPKSVT